MQRPYTMTVFTVPDKIRIFRVPRCAYVRGAASVAHVTSGYTCVYCQPLLHMELLSSRWNVRLRWVEFPTNPKKSPAGSDGLWIRTAIRIGRLGPTIARICISITQVITDHIVRPSLPILQKASFPLRCCKCRWLICRFIHSCLTRKPTRGPVAIFASKRCWCNTRGDITWWRDRKGFHQEFGEMAGHALIASRLIRPVVRPSIITALGVAGTTKLGAIFMACTTIPLWGDHVGKITVALQALSRSGHLGSMVAFCRGGTVTDSAISLRAVHVISVITAIILRDIIHDRI
jgi:hypothetical protein